MAGIGLRQVRAVIAVCEEGSFTRAAASSSTSFVQVATSSAFGLTFPAIRSRLSAATMAYGESACLEITSR